MWTLRKFQQATVDEAIPFLAKGTQGDSRLYWGPTGCGKGVIQGTLLTQIPHHIQIVPSIEIALDILDKAYGIKDFRNEAQKRETTENHRIFTVKRAYNLLESGQFPVIPDSVAFDESHHSTDDTHHGVWDMLGRPPRVGFTATAYRGTPQETLKLYEEWNRNITKIISLKDAIDQGVISAPTWDVWPLLNDDLIEVKNGEFLVSKVDSVIKDKMKELVNRVGQFFDGSTGLWDRPTLLAFNSKASCHWAGDEFTASGLPVMVVTEATTSKERAVAFQKVKNREIALINVSVVGEGVDLPIRRLIDVSPTMSPVRWMQRVGRTTRPVGPGEASPQYIACCHNLARHAYLWEGYVPAVAFKRMKDAWKSVGQWNPSRRQMTRALGLEGFGRFKPNEVPLKDGSWGTFYAFQTKDGREQYGVFLHPTKPSPTFFHRSNGPMQVTEVEVGGPNAETGTVEKQYHRDFGKWAVIQQLPNVEGCISLPPGQLSPGMKRKWDQMADRHGLDRESEVNARVFQILPCLWDTKLVIKGAQ